MPSPEPSTTDPSAATYEVAPADRGSGELECGSGAAPRHYSLGLWGTLLVAGVAALLLLSGLGLRTLTRHEVFASLPAREMLTSGNVVLPTFLGVYRTNKPPGVMWPIAGSIAIFGPSEFAARLPAALSGIAVCVIMGALAARWTGRRMGVVTGLICATSYFMILQARLAEADMPLTLCVAAAIGIFACCNIESPGRPRWNGRAWPIIFWILIGYSTLMKGAPGPGFILLTCIGFALLQRRWHTARFLLSFSGIALAVLIAAGWHYWAYRIYPPIIAVWQDEQEGAAGKIRAWWYYLYAVPFILLPWVPFALIGIARSLQNGFWKRPFALLLLCWFVPGMLVLMFAVASKGQHYAIPVILPACVMAAAGLIAALEGLAARSPARGPAYVRRVLAGAIGVAAVVCLAVGVILVPMFDDFKAEADVARAIPQLVPPDATVHLVGLIERPVAWYVREPAKRTDALPTFVAENQADPAYVLVREKDVPALGGEAETLARAATLRRRQAERDPGDRLVLVRLTGSRPTTRGSDN